MPRPRPKTHLFTCKEFIVMTLAEGGLHTDSLLEINKNLGASFTEPTIRQTLSALIQEGLVFSTDDRRPDYIGHDRFDLTKAGKKLAEATARVRLSYAQIMECYSQETGAVSLNGDGDWRRHLAGSNGPKAPKRKTGAVLYTL